MGADFFCAFISSTLAEPTEACSMLVGLVTGKHHEISVQDVGLSGKTEADGLAVPRPSGFVGRVIEPLLSGEVTVRDERLLQDLCALWKSEAIFAEPSACAGFPGVRAFHTPEMCAYINRELPDGAENAVHLVWANAAKTVPPSFTQIVKNSAGVTFLLVSSSEGVSVCDSVWCDEMEIVGKALNHLNQLGHRRIAFIGDRFSEERKKAYLEYMRTNNLPVSEDYIIETGSRFEKGGAEGFNRLLAVEPFPTAVFTVSDEMAIGIISTAAKNGITVPDNLSVVSVMDTPKAKYLYPSLTTVRAFGGDIGELVASMVIGRATNPMKKIEHVRLKPRLIFRESSAFLNSGKI